MFTFTFTNATLLDVFVQGSDMRVSEKLPSGKFHTKGRFTTPSGDQKALVIGGQSVKIEVITPTFYVYEDADSASKVLAHISNVEITSSDGFTVYKEEESVYFYDEVMTKPAR
jgi:hypothetical protein